MNRDNQNIPNEQRDRRGRRPGQMPQQRPGMGGQPMPAPPSFGPPGPGMEGMPRTAPPDFVPEPPGMERGQMGGPSGYGFMFFPDSQANRRELRRCINNFTFIWLRNGNSFWFFPTGMDNQFVRGFRWRRNRWEFNFINLNRILYFRCF